LTGLLTPQGPLDAFSQFEFLRPGILGISNFWAFRKRYAVLEKVWVPGLPNVPSHHPKAKAHQVDRVVGHKNIDDLKRRIDLHAHRVRLEDCYDMPSKVYQIRHVELTAEQHTIYQDLLDYSTAQLEAERHVTATMTLTVMLRLHQVVCGHVKDEEGQYFHVPTNRPAALLELLEQHDGKAIIWASYDPDIKAIQTALEEVYGEDSVARFWGGNLQTRDAEEKRFQSDPSCRFMIATAAAGGRGRMWATANLCVYFSNSASLEHRDQSEERAQAVGKTVPVLYVDLVAPGTVDEKFLHILRDKIDVDTKLSGIAWRQWVV
jgi:SNF2 family DNA or RNA helicase